MGNYKFRLSEMIPNAWFYRLRDTERARNHRHKNPPPSKPKKKQPPTTTTTTTTTPTKHPHPHHSLPRKSYHFTRDLHLNQNFQDPPFPHDPLRNIPSKPDPKPVHYSFAHASPVPDEVSSGVSTATVQPQLLPTQEFRLDCLLVAESPPLDKTTLCSSSSSTGSHGVNSVSGSNTVIHVDQHSFAKEPKKPHSKQGSLSQLQLPPIATKPKFKLRNSSAKQEESNVSAKEQHKTGPRRRSPAANYYHSPGVRLKTKSPRLLAKMKLEGHARKSSPAASLNPTRFGNSFAVVKSSSDPARDFRESMVEMIVENNIKASKDLEELLTCYLSLNSDEYHQVIVDVFKQIWYDLSDLSGLNELINY